MTDSALSAAPYGAAGYPRFFRIAGRWVNAYKVFLCVGCYLGIMTSAAVGLRSGLSPLRLGLGLLLFAIVGMLGARGYHLLAHHGIHGKHRYSLTTRDPAEGGWSVLGGLVIVPLSLLFDSIVGIPRGVFWDHMAIAIAVGGAWIRFGCTWNGCCVGLESTRWYAIRQHDVFGRYRNRIPVQWLEISWWVTAWVALLWLWPLELPTGSYAFAVLGWYGIGRFWLEPLRERSARIRGIRINQVVAGVMAVVGATGVLWQLL